MKKKIPTKILIVDDKPANLNALEKILQKPGLTIIKATSGNEALGLLLEHNFALVLLDVQMPDMDGFETAELMRGSTETSTIPIIFVTAISKEQQHVFHGYEVGAVDYLFKPLNPDILQSKVATFLKLHEQKLELIKMNAKLQKANGKIRKQQTGMIQEERLKVLLQMAGATAHELNQPLMALLGNIELMEYNVNDPKKSEQCLKRIKQAAERIADTVKKIQQVRNDNLKAHDNGTSIINLNSD